MSNKLVLLLSLLLVMLLWNCDPQDPIEENPAPTLNLISPAMKAEHMPTFTLTATGANFVPDSEIVFDGTLRATTFVSDSELTCQIAPNDILLVAGTASAEPGATVSTQSVTVLVRSPAPGGGDSDALQFTINDNPTFDSIINISANARDSQNPCITVDGAGGVNVAWVNRVSGNNHEIYFKRSGDSGATWGQKVNISNNGRRCYNPDIAMDEKGNINVVWNDYFLAESITPSLELYLGRSADNGGNWNVGNIENTLEEGWFPGSSNPCIALDSGGNINVAWHENTEYGSFELRFGRSTDNGVNWGQTTDITTGFNLDSNYPDIALHNTYVYLVWHTQGYTSGNSDVYFCSSVDNGADWGQPICLSTARYIARPVIETDSTGTIVVFWEDDPQNFSDIYFRRSTNNGASWNTVANISDTQGDSLYPAAAIDSAGNINLLWCDNAGVNTDIYFTRSIDGGLTWSTASNISASTGDSIMSGIAVDQEGNIYIVWEDETPGNYDIYFTRSAI